MIHYIKEHFSDLLITLVPSGGWFMLALETSNILLKIIGGLLFAIWLLIRIGIALKEYKKK